MVRQTQQIIMDNVRTQHGERACTLAQMDLLIVLIQIEAKVAMKQCPSILTPEAQEAHLWKYCEPLNLVQFACT